MLESPLLYTPSAIGSRTSDLILQFNLKKSLLSYLKDLLSSSPLQKEKDKAEKGTKGKKDKQGMAFATQVSQANIFTRFATKAVVEAFVTPAATRVGSPSIALSLLMPIPSYSEGNVSSS